MNIKWLGHSCFLITSLEGVRIVTDPFNDKVGYKPLSLSADIVTTSHNHRDHNYVEAISGDFTHVNTPGKINIRGINISGVAAFHDKEQGGKRGSDIIFIFDIDSLRIAHCGDLGHVVSVEQAKAIGKIDVLMVPVGGFYTIDAQEAAEVCSILNPKIVLPMHYKTDTIGFPIDNVDKFIETMGGAKILRSNTIEINNDNIPDYAGVVVLDYK